MSAAGHYRQRMSAAGHYRQRMSAAGHYRQRMSAAGHALAAMGLTHKRRVPFPHIAQHVALQDSCSVAPFSSLDTGIKAGAKHVSRLALWSAHHTIVDFGLKRASPCSVNMITFSVAVSIVPSLPLLIPFPPSPSL